MTRFWTVVGALALAAAVCALPAGGVRAASWRNAEAGRLLRLPADHASHPDYRIEWWYYTGNVAARDGRRFGYQLTFFRVGVDPAPVNPSRWAVRDLFMAHFAITDIGRKQHIAAERLGRAGVGWAGARTDAYHVWIDEWRVQLEDGRHRLVASSAAPAFTLDLLLDEGKPPAFHGDRGYSQKGSQPGNASHYYSLTRMPTRGTVGLGGERLSVEGESWMDHEFGSSFLEPAQAGWDWFSIQLDDGTELMAFQLRGRDGAVDPRSSATMIEADGRTSALLAGDFTLRPGRRWSSAATGGRYPVEWRIDATAAQLALDVRAAVDAQEMHAGLQSGLAYWEGAVDVSGTRHGRPVAGRGYLEMTGYAGSGMGEFLGRAP